MNVLPVTDADLNAYVDGQLAESRQAAVEGRQLGNRVNARLGRRRSPAARGRAITGVLADFGYEPRTADNVITLTNCPFHALAREHTDLVCGMNLDLLSGMLDTCDSGGLRTRLDPAPARCCVTLDRRRTTGSSEGQTSS